MVVVAAAHVYRARPRPDHTARGPRSNSDHTKYTKHAHGKAQTTYVNLVGGIAHLQVVEKGRLGQVVHLAHVVKVATRLVSECNKFVFGHFHFLGAKIRLGQG